MRERLYYQREGQPVLYEEANRNYNNCHAEISDNLIKQAKTIKILGFIYSGFKFYLINVTVPDITNSEDTLSITR